MKFWLTILFFLAEGWLLVWGMTRAVGSVATPGHPAVPPTFIPLLIAFVVILGLFAKLGCIDNAPKRGGAH